MENKQQENKGPHFWLAVGLIGIGLLLMLDNLRLIDFGDIWQLWPAVFIFIGVSKLKSGSSREKNSAYMFIGCGVFFMLLSLDILDWGDIWQFWPVVLILTGLSIIYRRSKWAEGESTAGQGHNEDRLDVVAIFGGHYRNVTSKNFQGGHVTAIFGGAELDFGEAKLAEGEQVLDVLSLFGGTELRVPKGWNVRFQGVPLFGGFEDKRREVPVEERQDDRSLTVKGVVLFGGLVIKSS